MTCMHTIPYHTMELLPWTQPHAACVWHHKCTQSKPADIMDDVAEVVKFAEVVGNSTRLEDFQSIQSVVFDPVAGAHNHNIWLGVVCVLSAAITSGFAGVYFERILKKGGHTVSIWVRNVQLSGFSMVCGLAMMHWKDGTAVSLTSKAEGPYACTCAITCTDHVRPGAVPRVCTASH